MNGRPEGRPIYHFELVLKGRNRSSDEVDSSSRLAEADRVEVST